MRASTGFFCRFAAILLTKTENNKENEENNTRSHDGTRPCRRHGEGTRRQRP